MAESGAPARTAGYSLTQPQLQAVFKLLAGLFDSSPADQGEGSGSEQQSSPWVRLAKAATANQPSGSSPKSQRMLSPFPGIKPDTGIAVDAPDPRREELGALFHLLLRSGDPNSFAQPEAPLYFPGLSPVWNPDPLRRLQAI
jgi:hypothetical protein